MFQPIHTANLNAIKALGKSGVFLKLEVIKKIIGLLVLAISIPLGVKAIAISSLFVNVICQIINSWPNKKLLNYHYFDQIKDIAPILITSIIMGVVVYFIGEFLSFSDFIVLAIQILVGAFVYVIESKLFHLDSFDYLLGIIKSYRG